MTAPAVWVLLRGLTRSRHHWGAFLDIWKNAFPHSRLVTLDIAGNGDRFKEHSSLTIEAMVEDCRTQLHLQGVPPGFGILAVSMGGMVAVQWAQQFPQEIKRLVLVNISMRPFSPFHHRLQLHALFRLLSLTLRRASPQTWEEAIAALTSSTAGPATVDHWVELRLRQPVSPGNALRQLLAAARFHAKRNPPDTSVLVLGSRLDRLVSVQCSEAISLQWAVALLVHPSAGHDLTLDDGEWVSSAVQCWLAET